MTDPFGAAAASAARLAELTGQDRHDVAVVLGSGWAPAADALASGLDATVTEIPVAELGGFPPPTVAGHAGLALSMVDAGAAAAGLRRPGAPVRGSRPDRGRARRADRGRGRAAGSWC